MAPFPFPAHQTGRADFSHPAFRQTSRQAHGGGVLTLNEAYRAVDFGTITWLLGIIIDGVLPAALC